MKPSDKAHQILNSGITIGPEVRTILEYEGSPEGLERLRQFEEQRRKSSRKWAIIFGGTSLGCGIIASMLMNKTEANHVLHHSMYLDLLLSMGLGIIGALYGRIYGRVFH